MKWPWRKSPPPTPEGDAAAELVARVAMLIRDAESRVDALRTRLSRQLASQESRHVTDP